LPEPAFTAPPEYQRTTYQQGNYGRPAPHPGVTQPVPAPPPPLQSRSGKALKWAVSALLIAALGLGSWQLAEALMERGSTSDDTNQTQTTEGDGDKNKPKPSLPIAIQDARDFDPFGDSSEKPGDIDKVYDSAPGTYWETAKYYGEFAAKFGNLKSGVGVILDLGKVQDVGKVSVTFEGSTAVELRAASGEDEPQSFESFTKVADGSGTDVDLKPSKELKARYVLVWLTELPMQSNGEYRGRVVDIKVTS
jgi:hypothetical protein